MTNSEQLENCYAKAREDLLGEQSEPGRWRGELSSSALSTATAVSALSLVCRQQPDSQRKDLIQAGLRWLSAHQNDDGGFGDTDRSLSNIATTLLVKAAFHLADAAQKHSALLAGAEEYIESQNGLAGLRKRYGKDKTFAVPILTNCALAGLVSWEKVDPLPFELACLPQAWYRFARMPVVSYAIPALVAIGQARFVHRPPWNPLIWGLRKAAVKRSLKVLLQMQPESGGYLEATPLTSFVVMSLASIGRHDHPVTRQGVQFLVDSVRPDGSWPIDTDLATWNTSLALNALAASGEDVTENGDLNWLLKCQHRVRHPFTGAEPGGWGWTDLSGAVPDADDTPAALLALNHWRCSAHCTQADRAKIIEAARQGMTWLLHLQNSDGGWPTFCKGWGKLPFDRSGADLTAHALRALLVWRDESPSPIDNAVKRGLAYLEKVQRSDGSWIPLWFGNQHHAEEENPIYGTAKVLLAYRDLDHLASSHVRKAFDWLISMQNGDGSFGRGVTAVCRMGTPARLPTERNTADGQECPSYKNTTPSSQPVGSIEETALAVEALLADETPQGEAAAAGGVRWLMEAVEKNLHRQAAPIGFYFAKLWYYERLYPITFTVSALGRAARRWPKPSPARLSNASNA